MTSPRPTLRTVPTADLGPDGLRELRTFLDGVFTDGFRDDHWSHARGGLHVLASRDGVLVGHAAVVGRQLVAGDLTLRTGYVEAVAVAADARRQGLATALMTEVERLVRGGYELGALAASEDGVGLYESRGWTRWRGPLCAFTPDGRTEGDASRVFVLPTPETPAVLDPELALVCDWRRGSLW
ncbi:GNAT family N-acetyltransferase [Klenkia brasiliensis]|uniref:Aminoglycoside 2'-N-acetyltransferase I n=1 Tax=Klenkia brasiliensis TaxID=333142 RepID=A0A1G7Q597_9ACTN|nr:GNAT family N-acetyltransferase [Klenkia brasiliensis]SDF93722.1 aminoglycoside 2'-N-acetyltransferase I [Klenkia brasiliensis]